jgi:peptidoglycan/xylan/chitin deacetylase (PgdA/CDA1 family)
MMALVVRAQPHCSAEFAWICEVLFGQWLGLSHRIEPHDQPWVEVHAVGGCVRWPDAFFEQAHRHWLETASLPAVPPPRWTVPDDVIGRRIGQSDVVRLFGDADFTLRAGLVDLPIDITGSAFFMLSRYEEAVSGAAADRYGRFPGSASVVQRAGVALRPLVDEWVELLWWAIEHVAPGLQRRPRTPRVWVSCDVDLPYSPGAKSAALALRQAASHLVNDRSPRLAAQSLVGAVAARAGIDRFDPVDTFDWMLDVNERAGNRVSFFMLSVVRPQRIDCCYELAEPRIARLLRKLVARGHELGLHGSYGSLEAPGRLARELDGLRDAVALAGGEQDRFGGRQHYLRWHAREAPRGLAAAGLAYDSTLGFADIAGFRCGTCHAFPLFDLGARRALAVIERPLVLMEVTVTSRSYLNLGQGDEAMRLMTQLRETCRRFGGEFALLWHNSNLSLPGARALYEALVQPL